MFSCSLVLAQFTNGVVSDGTLPFFSRTLLLRSNSDHLDRQDATYSTRFFVEFRINIHFSIMPRES